MTRTLLSVVLGAVLQANSTWAAPCCGGGSSLPSLITGDDRSQLSALISYGSVIGDAPPQGIPVFRSTADSEVTQTMRLDGAYLLTDGVQMGASIPFVRRSRKVGSESASAQGLADLGFDVAYEFLPELTYSPWKPKGFTFLQINLPTSPSVYDGSEPYLLDARSRGFLFIALGTAFVKTVGNWDLLFSAELHRSFSRTFRNSNDSFLVLVPGWGGSAILGAGYSPGGGAFRVGLSLSPVFEGAVLSQGDISSVSDSQLVWNTSLQLSYALEKGWAANFIYTDQTLVGPVKNVSLSRTLSAAIQKRWEL